ncbi:MAG: tRNA 2-thiouridine(34) synthase MnmA [Bacteroidales bacterium]|nr:tRNA 2-thiouridine(34) synthase MnmA [Bacteroidales bacterium]
MSTKVLVCVSGGIDSSLSTLLLKEQGFDIIAATFRVYDSIQQSCLDKMKGCCSIETIAEAKYFAEQQGVEHYILDYREYFADTVINNFINQYIDGKTPNPCVLCNAEIKWGKVLDFAVEKGCHYVATGHYARVYKKNNRYVLAKGKDELKDQSYFLWMLTQEQLAKTIFPLGELTKEQVRSIAKKKGFFKLAEKRESQEICFVPNNDYRSFLKEHIIEIQNKIKKGNFITTDGKIVGQHHGIAFYTVGQRKGLGIALGEPYYIVEIRKDTNEIVLGKYEELQKKSFNVAQINMVAIDAFTDEMEVEVKIRYRTKPIKAKVYNNHKGQIIVKPIDPIYAVTPGQSAVFYKNDEVLAGGIIV